MSEFDRTAADPDAEHGEPPPEPELSEADLECVVGGLARPLTETSAEVWQLEPIKTVL